jgi:hypothetical protein
VPSPAKGVPARFVSVGPAAAAKASSEGWRLCLRPNNGISSLASTYIYRNHAYRILYPKIYPQYTQWN